MFVRPYLPGDGHNLSAVLSDRAVQGLVGEDAVGPRVVLFQVDQVHLQELDEVLAAPEGPGPGQDGHDEDVDEPAHEALYLLV